MCILVDTSSRKTPSVKAGLYPVLLAIDEDGGAYDNATLTTLMTIPQPSPHPVLNTTYRKFTEIPLNFDSYNREDS